MSFVSWLLEFISGILNSWIDVLLHKISLDSRLHQISDSKHTRYPDDLL